MIDTSPLIYLALIGKLGLLIELYEEILVTAQILSEVKEGRPGYEEINDWISHPHVRIREVDQTANLLGLGSGERSAIALCQLEEDIELICDDQDAGEPPTRWQSP